MFILPFDKHLDGIILETILNIMLCSTTLAPIMASVLFHIIELILS